jgi:ABC-2 type transport system ATP-binding protein
MEKKVVIQGKDLCIGYRTGKQEKIVHQHLNFELHAGELTCLLGANGAGKSTLLKAVSGVMEPSQGEICVRGRVSALLELGSGFDGDLTVKENTYLRGAMLGYSRELMREVYGEIIDFAELSAFQDRAFKQLSSGMRARLAFSIASRLAPDILILDEVLSVGDGAFREKSERKMKEIKKSGDHCILVTGLVFLAVGVILTVIWYFNFYNMV